MKTLSSLILLTALAATIVLPLRIELAVTLLSVAGVAAMIITDYARRSRFPRVDITAAVMAVRSSNTSLRLAA